jgi:nucleotide-binding universal stress UspA family protein
VVGGVAVKKILAAIDRSKYKEKIIAYAISLGKAWGAEVTAAIHVNDPGRGVSRCRVKEKEKQREEEAERPAEDLLGEAELQAKKEGISLRKEIVEESDTVEKAIIDYARKNNIDVILIGTTGTSAAEGVFLGSVANNVIHHAHCPVFPIRLSKLEIKPKYLRQEQGESKKRETAHLATTMGRLI